MNKGYQLNKESGVFIEQGVQLNHRSGVSNEQGVSAQKGVQGLYSTRGPSWTSVSGLK